MLTDSICISLVGNIYDFLSNYKKFLVKGRDKWFMFDLNERRVMYIILYTISAIRNIEEKAWKRRGIEW